MIKFFKKYLMDEYFFLIIVVYSDQLFIVYKVQMFEKYFISWCIVYKWVRILLIRIILIFLLVWQRCIIYKKKIFKVKNQCFMIFLKILIFDVFYIIYVSIVFFQIDIEEKSFMVVDFKELFLDDGIFI